MGHTTDFDQDNLHLLFLSIEGGGGIVVFSGRWDTTLPHQKQKKMMAHSVNK